MGPRLTADRWTIALVALLIAIHAAVELAGGAWKVPQLYQALGLHGHAFRAGHGWQIVSYGFLHASWVHVSLNCLALYFAAARIQVILGAAMMIRCFLMGIVFGGIAHLLMGAAGQDVLVGASGGLMAMVLLLTTLSPDSRMWPIPISGRSFGYGLLVSSLILALINPRLGIPYLASIGKQFTAYGLSEISAMGHACHLGGGIAGLALGGWILRKRVTLHRLQRQRRANE